MAGYSGFSMSNNAVAARGEGKFPATDLAREIGRGATAAGVRAVLIPVEWHHTSSRYNRTDFFELDHDAEILAERDEITESAARDVLIERIIAASKPAKSADVIHENCQVEWLEWSGSRNHPHCERRAADGCRVIDSGRAMLRIVFADGTEMKKKRDCNGLKITSDGARIN